MEYSYSVTGENVCVDKVKAPGAFAAVPETLDGRMVTELGAYAFAGTEVEEVHLPAHLKKIGAYGFYGCENLKRIFCSSRILDLGTGVFAGVQHVEYLDFTEFFGEKSCFKDLLSELRQTLRVRIRQADETSGQIQEARLIFPEYFEESVENTPARILFIETHGCGHRYRYCFSGRTFQFHDYDELFPHVKVQEKEELVTELALGRLMYPLGLSESRRTMYLEYVNERWQTAGQLLAKADTARGAGETNLDPGRFPWFVEEIMKETPLEDAERRRRLDVFVETAQKAGDTEAVSWLMDYRRSLAPETAGRRFEL